MALMARRQVGSDDIMRSLAQDVQRETDPQIRRLTIITLNEYFSNK